MKTLIRTITVLLTFVLLILSCQNTSKKKETKAIEPEGIITVDGINLHYKIEGKVSDYEYFINSRGYYLEWIRDEWISEEDPQKIKEFLISPNKMLKDLAPTYKRIESSMEESFWNSKYE